VQGNFSRRSSASEVPGSASKTKQVTQELSSQVEARQPQVPENVENLLVSGRKFFRDLGWTPQTDITKTSTRLTNSIKLQKRIDYLRGQVHEEIVELRHRSDKYIHFAETAGHYLQDAERFFERHPNLLWLLKMAGPK
jgi:hypothetical protein